MTLGKLDETLQRPSHEISRRPKDSRSVAKGWACGGDLCTVTAFFLAPTSGDVPSSAVPVQLWITQNPLAKPFAGSIGGIHLGDTKEKLAEICRKRGFQLQSKDIRVPWDKDWEVHWLEKDDRIISLMFFNRTLVKRALSLPAAPDK